MERVGDAVPGLVRRRDVDALVHEPGAELRRQRCEVIAIGTEPVQPDHGSLCGTVRGLLDRVKNGVRGGHGGLWA